MALPLAGILASGIPGLLGGGGANPSTYAERKALVGALSSLASSGNKDAWNLLGAVAGIRALAAPVNLPGLPGSYNHPYAAGFLLSGWGTAYNPILKQAADAYNAAASRFAADSPVSGGGGSLGGPILTAVATPTGWPWYVWGLLALLVALLLFRFLK